MIETTINFDLDKDLKKAVKEAEDAMRKELLLKLKEATPVDTGEARDSWQISGNSLINTAEHISYLNKGSSQQAPSHFIEKTVLSTPGIKANGLIVQET